jgi:hypothetical protein
MSKLAGSLYTKFGRVGNTDNIGTVKGGACTCDFNCALFPWNSVPHENYSSVVAGDEVSPMRDLFNTQFDQITDF